MTCDDDDLKDLKQGVKEILLLLRGDGSDQKPGLVVRVDRLEQRDKQRAGAVALFWTAIIAAATCVLDAVFRAVGLHKP